jgi:hypothetical protein
LPRVSILSTLLSVAVTLPFVLLVAGCGDDGDEAETEATPVAGTFVGEVGSGDRRKVPFIAVVAAPAKNGQQAREVKVYVCDGFGINEWFPGSATGDRFKLTSDDGDAEVNGRLTASSVTGTVTLPDGKSIRFNGKPATGPGGLYDVTASRGGQLRGTSTTEARLAGRQAQQETNGRYPLTATIRVPAGKRFRVATTPTRPVTGSFRWIVLSDGLFTGDRKGVRTAEGGGGDYFIREVL